MRLRDKALKNVISNTIYYLVITIMSFITRRIFVVFIGSEALGLNGLLTSIISMLSLLELGFAGAIGYSLYKPLEEMDNEKINLIMTLFARIYKYIGITILIIGLAIIPCLKFFIETMFTEAYIYTVYSIFLIDTVLSYFLAYRRILIQADQKTYLVKKIDTLAGFLISILQITVIIATHNYILYLLVKIVVIVITNIYIYKKIGRMYPVLNKSSSSKLDEKSKSIIFNNVKSLFVIKIASYCVVGTDNILLSKFGNLREVAIYSNYIMIINVVNNIFNGVFSNITANLGNFILENEEQKVYQLYRRLFFINFVITSFTTVALLVLLNEFIGGVWLGEKYTWSNLIVIILVFNNYLRYITMSSEAFRGAAGLYSPRPFVKYLSLLEGITNLVVSILLAKYAGLGIYGIFLGTSISTVIGAFGVPWIVYFFLLHKSLKKYFKIYIKYFISTVIFCVISVLLFYILKTSYNIINIIIGLIISFGVTLSGVIILYGKTEEWKYVQELVIGYFSKQKY